MVEFMFINKNALRRCCVGIALSSLCSVSGMSSLMPEMINEEMLKATVDKYKEEIGEIGNIDNAPLLYIRMVLQTFVDNDKTEIEGLRKGVISDDFLNLSLDVGDKNLWLYIGPYEVVKGYIDSLGLLAKSESNPLCDDGRDQRTRSSLINLSLLTSEMVEKRIAELLEKKVVSNDDVNTIETPSADLAGVADEIKQILPGGEYFGDFIVLLSELNERSGCSIALPSVSDFVNLGRRFIALVAEKSELEEKCSLTAGEVKKIEGEKINVENELNRIKEQLSEAWKYVTDGVYSSDDCVKVVKTIDSSNLNGITSSIAIEKVGVYNNEEFGLVSKKNEEKAKLLDKGTHDAYNKETEGVYDKYTSAVVTKKEAEMIRSEEYVVLSISELRRLVLLELKEDDELTGRQISSSPLAIYCQNGSKDRHRDKNVAKKAKAEVDLIFPLILKVKSLFLNIEYAHLNFYEMSLLKSAKQALRNGAWEENASLDVNWYNDRYPGRLSDIFVQKLNDAITAAEDATSADTSNMLCCKIGKAKNETDLRVQLLLAAIAGCNAEDIKKTF